MSGHDFSRAANATKKVWALAPAACFSNSTPEDREFFRNLPHSLKSCKAAYRFCGGRRGFRPPQKLTREFLESGIRGEAALKSLFLAKGRKTKNLSPARNIPPIAQESGFRMRNQPAAASTLHPAAFKDLTRPNRVFLLKSQDG